MTSPQRPTHGMRDNPPSDPSERPAGEGLATGGHVEDSTADPVADPAEDRPSAVLDEPAEDLPTDPHGFRAQPWPPGSQPVWIPGQPGWTAGQSGWSGPPPRSWPPPAGWMPAPPVQAPPPHRWGFGAFLLAEGVFLLASFLIVVPFMVADPTLGASGAELRGAALLVSLAVPTVLAALVAILITKVRGNGPIIDLRLRFGWRDVGIGVTCGVIGVILTIPLGMLWAHWVGEEDANSAVGEIFDGVRMSPLLALLVFVNIWLLAPLCEEILYRGLLWGAMERRRWNQWIILAITTVVFAAAHGELKRAPLLLAIGLPMGVARMLSGRLPAAIIAHQINNFLPALGLTLILLGVPLADA